MAPNEARRIFIPTNPDLADILGRTDLNFEKFYFFDIFGPQIQKPPLSPPPPTDEPSDPNVTPLPTHPGIKYVARALAATKYGEQSGLPIGTSKTQSGERQGKV